MEHLKIFLLVTSFIVPLFLSFQLYFSTKQILSRKIISLALLNTSLIYFCNYFYFSNEYFLYAPLHSLHAALELSIFPLIHLYIKSLIGINKNIKREWLHFLPAIVVLIIGSYLFYIYIGKEDLLHFLEKNKSHTSFHTVKFRVLNIARYIDLCVLILQAMLYGISFFKLPRHYDELLKNEFSNIDFFSIGWINKYNLLFAIVTFMGMILYFFIPIHDYRQILVIVIFFLLSMFVCTMGFVGLTQKKPNISMAELELKLLDYKEKNDVLDEKLLKKLNHYLEKEKAYLRTDLTLTAISKDIGTNRTYLSALINKKYGLNFNAFVNQFRIEYLRKYIEENPSVKKEELMHKGGFGSISTMQRALKKENIKFFS